MLTIPLEIQQVMGLQTAHAEVRAVEASRAFPGRFELNPDARQMSATPVEGRLTLHVKPLARVKVGDPLFSVASPDLVAQAHQIAVIERRLAVYREAKTPNAALESELAVLQAAREAALAGADETNGVVIVRATVEGLVEDLIAAQGAWVERGASVVQLVQPHNLRFVAQVAAEDVATLADGIPATVGAEKGILRLGVGDASGLVPVYVTFDRTVASFAGARGVLECVVAGAHQPQLAVPTEAIVTIGLQPTVFVQDHHHPVHFIAVPVVLKQKGGGWTAVEGLPSEHCEVVCAGAYELKLALATGGEKSAGHFHADGVFHEGEH